jgi:hypothetical protein
VARLSPQKRWKLRAYRHLVIQTAGFVIGIIIAVVCAVDGNWIAAGVVVFIACFPGTMATILLHKIRSVPLSDAAPLTATRSD